MLRLMRNFEVWGGAVVSVYVSRGLRALVGRGALAGLALFVALMCVPTGARAVNVTVGAVTYDIQFFAFNRSFDDDEAALMLTPWWGDATLADNIADAYLAQVGVLGSPFTDNPDPLTNLLFAYETFIEPIGPTDSVRAAQLNEGFFPPPPGPAVAPASERAQFAASANIVFAHGTIVPAGPAAVPEIDGNALAKALFLLFTLYVWLQVRRNRRMA